jgi:hypothetical protein
VVVGFAILLGACGPRLLTLGEWDATVQGDDGGDAAACVQSSDCPPGQACDPVAGVCSTNCVPGVLCNGGCCGNGSCQSGDASGYCGSLGSTCAQCGGNTPTCTDGLCVGTCGDAGPQCGAGYCCGVDGGCVAGNAGTTCGSQSACIDCTSSSVGHTCISGRCGCLTAADCPVNKACDLSTKSCTSTCGTAGAGGCNGGCCNPTTSMCVTGGLASACGNDGGFCFTCPQAGGCNLKGGNGPRCLHNDQCGCYETTGNNRVDAANGSCEALCGSTARCSNVEGGVCLSN